MAHIKLKGNVKSNRTILRFGREQFIISRLWTIIPDKYARDLNRDVYDIVINGRTLETKRSKYISKDGQEVIEKKLIKKEAPEKETPIKQSIKIEKISEIINEPEIKIDNKIIADRGKDLITDLKDDGKRNYSHDLKRKTPGRKPKKGIKRKISGKKTSR